MVSRRAARTCRPVAVPRGLKELTYDCYPEHTLAAGPDRGDDPDPRSWATSGRRAFSTCESRCSASASARACSDSAAAKPTTASRPILFGGYVKMAGEQPGDENADDPRGFLAKPRWQRLIIAFAGPFMNVVLAVGLLTGLFMVKYQKLAEPPISGRGRLRHARFAGGQGGRPGGRPHRADRWQAESHWEDISAEGSRQRRQGAAMSRWSATASSIDDHGDAGAGRPQRRGHGRLVASRTRCRWAASRRACRPRRPGSKKGDLMLSVNGQPIRSVLRFHDTDHDRATASRSTLELERDGQQQTITVQPVFSKLDGPERWMIGVDRRSASSRSITTKLSLARRAGRIHPPERARAPA